ncbi:MAG: hypothetical protein L6Q37_07100 [Bdellovibrionaceae bacterium]|nr:hypothetical protein [Pseudobdellovibrionaceae bacterium]NUM59256.1 hypothetical protein [Pseudobdellovibrionaceae bacterium]
MLKSCIYFLLVLSFTGNLLAYPKFPVRNDLPAPFPITKESISFSLLPNEPGPTWECRHEPVPNLPYDWKVTCLSQTSKVKLSFLVHFLVRVFGQKSDILEVLYWVDEYPQVLYNRSLPQSHGQSSLIGFQDGMLPNRMSLGQFVQNGTSSLNILYFIQLKKK